MRNQTLPGRFGVILSMTLGWQILYLLCIAVLGSIVANSGEMNPALLPSNIAIVNGQPYKWKWVPTMGWSLSTMDDQPLPASERRSVMLGATLLSRAAHDSLVSDALFPVESWSMNGFFRAVNVAEPWYIIQEKVGDHFTVYLAGYSNRTRAPIRYLGAKGESSTVPPPEDRFRPLSGSRSMFNDMGTIVVNNRVRGLLDTTSGQEASVRENFLLITQEGLEAINIRTGKTVQILPSNTLYTMASPTNYKHEFGGMSVDPGDGSVTLLLRTSDMVYTLKNLEVTAQTLIPQELRNRDFTILPVSSDVIYYALYQGENALGQAPNQLFKCDSSGHILETYAVKQPEYRNDFLRRSRYLPIVMFCASPLTIAGVFAGLEPTPELTTAELLQIAWPAILVLIACGAGSAFAAWKLAPRFSGAHAQFGWLAYVFVFALPSQAPSVG
jgi:hypothetical protein